MQNCYMLYSMHPTALHTLSTLSVVVDKSPLVETSRVKLLLVYFRQLLNQFSDKNSITINKLGQIQLQPKAKTN